MCLFIFTPHSSEKNQLRWARNRLETDVCVAGHQVADPDVIQSYVKRVSSSCSVFGMIIVWQTIWLASYSWHPVSVRGAVVELRASFCKNCFEESHIRILRCNDKSN